MLHFTKVGESVGTLYDKVYLRPTPVLRPLSEPRTDVCLDAGDAEGGLNLPDMLEAYALEGVSLPGVVRRRRESIRPIVLIAEGVLPDAQIIKERVVVHKLIQGVRLGCIGRCEMTDETALFQFFQYGSECATV